MPKKKTIARLLDDAALLLQRIRRIEEADENGYCACVSCGKVDHWKELEGGHWIPRTKTATKITPENINPQCHSCNHFRKEEAAPAYALWMIERHGKEYCDILQSYSKQTIKRSRNELLDTIEEFKIRLANLERNAN